MKIIIKTFLRKFLLPQEKNFISWRKYAKILGYNYQSSSWYKKSYKVFNKNYKDTVPKKIDKNKKGVVDKFKKLFD